MLMSAGLTRRQVLAAAAASSAGLVIGRDLRAAQPEPRRVRVGVVGTGARGTFLLATMLGFPDVEVPAVCDVDSAAAERARDIVEKHSGRRPDAYTAGESDWEKLVARDDLDAVVIATPWDIHARIAVAAMRAGKFVGLEVPACLTMDEAWDLVHTSEDTGQHCMLLENVNYFRNVLAMQRLIREGVLGTVTHALVGYLHSIPNLSFTDDGKLTWRGRMKAKLNGNLYPTHPIGPTAWWMNINRGDRFVRLRSVSTKPRYMREYARRRFGAEHPLARRQYALGDTNTTIIETANGHTITLYFDICSPRPYDLIFRVQGTKGCYEGNRDSIYVEGSTPEGQWEVFSTAYQEKYEHPLWRDLAAEAKKNGGHGGCDYITVHQFLKSVRGRTRPPIDVYDAATWSAIVPLSIASVANKGEALDYPDFTRGRWKKDSPIPLAGA